MLYWKQHGLMTGVLGYDNALMLRQSSLGLHKTMLIHAHRAAEEVFELCPLFGVFFIIDGLIASMNYVIRFV